jgi:hypothetical protein
MPISPREASFGSSAATGKLWASSHANGAAEEFLMLGEREVHDP